jgi:menaquinone-dependent protoporphyrinogen IX oxidase
MKTLVVYYSWSGNTRLVATALAKNLNADVEELRCDRYRPGARGYIRAASDSWWGKLPLIEPLTHVVSQYELVVIAGPIWAWHPAPPIRTFLQQERSELPRVAFLLTHGGAAGEKSLREMAAMVDRPPVSAITITEGDIKARTFANALNVFAASLRKAEAA